MDNIKSRLDDLYIFFRDKYLNTSMLSIPHLFQKRIANHNKTDLEAIAFVSAMYDFQVRVPIIKRNFEVLIDQLALENIKLEELADPSIARNIIEKVTSMLGRSFHRYDPRGEYIPVLVRLAYNLDLEREAMRYREHDKSLLKGLWREILSNRDKYLGSIELDGFKRFLGSPDSRNSSHKRINLFLRWVVRDEYPDLGLWASIDKKELYIPLGGEITRTAGRVFYGKELEQNRRCMYKLTKELSMINPDDPVKYDFVLSRLQLLGICLKKLEYSHCSICPLRDICKINKLVNVYINPLYSNVKEYIDDKRIKKAKEKHDFIVKRTIEYLVNNKLLLRDIIRSDYVIDHGLRPDIFYINDILVLGEIKTRSKYVQGPQQLRVYLDELLSQGIDREERIGILSYGRMFEGDLNLIQENIELLRLNRGFNRMYILDFHGNPMNEPEVVIMD